MAPEQIRGVAVDHRADIFAFGATLYEMLSGERAFAGETAADTMTAILTKEPPELDAARLAISPALDRIVRRCLEKSPDLRFQSATDFAFALETLSSSATPTGSAIGTVPAPARSRGGRARRSAPQRWPWLRPPASPPGGIYPAAKPRGLPEFTRLTFRRGLISGARFAPDGQNIVYSAVWDSEPERIYPLRVERPRAEAQPLVDGSLIAVSPSGDMAVKLNPEQLNVFMARGSWRKCRSPAASRARCWTRWMPATSHRTGGSPFVRLVGGRVRLEFPAGTVLFESAGWISAPGFLPDGTRLVFHEHPLMDDDRGWVSLLDLRTGAVRRLTEEYGTLSGLAWAPGTETCFASGEEVICVAAAATAPARVVVRGASRLILQDIAADGACGRRIYTLHAKQGPRIRRERHGPVMEDIRADRADARRPQAVFGTIDYSILMRGLNRSPAVRLGNGFAIAFRRQRWVLRSRPPSDEIMIVPTGAGSWRTLPRGRSPP